MLKKNELPKKIPMNPENKNSKKKQTSESETCENSNSEHIKIKKKPYKRSVDFFPKKMEIEEIDEDFSKRRNTISIPGNYVPQIKPIKVDIIPSKLRLNKICFKDLKCNKNNKVLLYANKYFISCPNKENYIEKDINQTRKNLGKTKNNIPKVSSVNNPHLKNKYNKELNMGYSSESDFYDIDESLNDSINENEEIKFEINVDNKNEINKKRDRYNSWSILEILQKKNKLDEK